jgi:hypothetical protein
MRFLQTLLLLVACALVGACGGDEPEPQKPAEGGAGKKTTDDGGTQAPEPAGTGKKKAVKLPPPVLAGKKGRTYRHVAGFSFWYPAGWTVKEHDDFLQLIPPDAKKNAQGATEAYLILGDTAEGITSPADARVAAYLDGKMRQLSPVLRRTGGSTPVKMSSGQGALYVWKGKNAQGKEVQARAYSCIVKNFGLGLVALGISGHVDARDREIRRIFASFAFGKGKKDAALVGKWVLRNTHSMQNDSVWETDWSRAKAVSENRSWLTFSADGTWKRLDKYHMIAGAGDLWIEDKRNTVSEGTWNAGDGVLFMMWKDGSWDDFKYKVDTSGGGKRLRLVSGRKGEVWVPSQ